MIVKEITQGDEWNKYLAGQERPVILQSYEWGELKGSFGWQPFRLALYDRDEIRGGISLLRKKIPASNGHSLFYAPRGPVLSEWKNENLTLLLDAVRKLARQEKAVFLRIDPAIAEDDVARTELLRASGFRSTSDDLQPRRTIIVDLRRPEEEIISSFHHKQRYNIRLAVRKGVRIDQVSTADGVARFYRLLEQTTIRQKFLVHPKPYYEKILNLLAEKQMADIYIATHENDDLAAAFTFRLGRRVWYMYGASAEKKRNRMPGHLLHWEIMRRSREQGAAAYDLWGIPNNPKQGEPLWGVYRFKRGFNGDTERLIGCYDLVFKPVRYQVFIKSWQTIRGLRNLAVRGRIQGVYGN